jgi:hypothetical protein
LVLRYNLRPEAPILLCAVPQHGEHGLMERAEHAKMTRELFAQLSDSGANVVLSLHPRSDPKFYEDVAQATGAVISRQPLLEVIASADIFVATHSSTVRWAILLNIPTVVLDDFHVGESGMFELNKVQLVKDRSTLKDVLAGLVKTPTRYGVKGDNAKEEQAPELFDGKSGARIIALLEKFANNPALRK